MKFQGPGPTRQFCSAAPENFKIIELLAGNSTTRVYDARYNTASVRCVQGLGKRLAAAKFSCIESHKREYATHTIAKGKKAPPRLFKSVATALVE